MMQSNRLHRYRHAALGSACALAMLLTVAPVRAQDDTVDTSNSIWNLEKRIWSGVVNGLGLRSSDDPVITYRERSPLVVPPTRDLPPPQAKAAPRDPSWPVDPDVARAKQRALVKRTVGNDLSRELDRQSRPLSADELNRPGNAPRTADSGKSNAPASGPEGRAVTPSELGYFGGLFSLRAWGFGGYANETGTFTSEPPRTALTEPPPGYQTPSAEQPYGTSRRIEHTAPKPFDPAGRQ